jgi:hypothetical protein
MNKTGDRRKMFITRANAPLLWGDIALWLRVLWLRGKGGVGSFGHWLQQQPRNRRKIWWAWSMDFPQYVLFLDCVIKIAARNLKKSCLEMCFANTCTISIAQKPKIWVRISEENLRKEGWIFWRLHWILGTKKTPHFDTEMRWNSWRKSRQKS